MVRDDVARGTNRVSQQRVTYSHIPAAGRNAGLSRCWRATNGAACLLFTAAAVVQWNDPDPHVWMPFYGIAAAIAAHVARSSGTSGGGSVRWWRGACLLELLYSLGLAASTVYHSAEKVPDMLRQPFVQEEARELAGALAVLAYILLLTLNAHDGRVTALGAAGHAAAAAGLCLLVIAAAGLWSACWTPIGVSLAYCASLCSSADSSDGSAIGWLETPEL